VETPEAPIVARPLWSGERVRLRGFQAADWELFFAWDQEPDWSWADTREYFPPARDRIRAWADEEAQRGRRADEQRFIIETLEGVPVGTIDTARCDRLSGAFWYGIAISQAHRRSGYAREAIVLTCRFYFDQLGYQKVNTSVWSFNAPSLALHAGLGFVEEGRLRRTHFRAGRHFDEHILGLTVEEFRARHC
jgi:RimJ/RimL family protein N-acetyltransferase